MLPTPGAPSPLHRFPFTGLRRLLARLLRLLALLGLLGAGSAPAAAQAPASTVGAQIDAYIAAVRATVPIPGLSLAVVHGASVEYIQGYGEAAPGRAVTPQTPFWIASLSKPFTALAVRQLVHAGLLDLDAPVQTYIPWFTLADPAVAAKIRVRHLLDHTSGLSTSAGGLIYFDASPTATREDLVRGLKEVSPSHLGQTEYSNYNYVVLGYLIEVVTGQSYEDYLRAQVLTPLGLTHTHFSDQASKADGGVTGYQLLFGLPVPFDEPYKPAMQSSGYLISSAEDMGRFAQLYLNNGVVNGANLVGAPPTTTNGYYSIYWQWIGDPVRPGLPEHQGGMLTNNSTLRIYPDRDLAIVVLLNVRPDGLFRNLNAATIVDNVAAIVAGGTPNPPNDQGWSRSVRAFNLQVGGFLALWLMSMGLTLLWRRRWLARRGAAVIAGLALLLEAALAVYGVVAPPLIHHSPWTRLLKSAPDLNGSQLGLGLLFAFSAVFKLITLWQRRARRPAPRPA